MVAIEKQEGQERFLVKWRTLGYDDATWHPRKELEKLPCFEELVLKRRTVTKGTVC